MFVWLILYQTVALRFLIISFWYMYRRECIKKTQSNKLKEKKRSRNYAHYIIRVEKKKLKRYRIKETSALSELDSKKWQLKVKKAEDRIVLLNDELLKPIKKTEQSEVQNINNVQEDPKDEEYLDQDSSRRRLGQLKAIVKNLIFTTGDAISKIDVENECPDATPEEILVCLSILYFSIFANDFLKATGYSEFTRSDTKKKLVMLIGDRGTGVGSRIKGFRRYGGKWKEEIHTEAIFF
ncbi:hypothetical protein EDC94DRAFT_653427 [Helicostylum pulchrum]|nr:hypothetical protein EDC94DRAFT_653427 [Helicostylum pulchrum]